MDLDFYRDLLKQEFARGDSLAARSNAIVAGLTTLGGAIGFLVVGFKDPGGGPTNCVFWSFTIGAGLAISVAIGYLISYYWVPSLRDIEKASAWRTYFAELTEEYKSGPGGFASATAEFEHYLISAYVEATDHNSTINTLRGYRLVASNFAMIAAFVLVILAALSYYYSKLISPPLVGDQEITRMLSNPESLVCIPTGHAMEAATAPGTRPVPAPRPNPAPTPAPRH